MQLRDRGLLKLDDPVVKYVPELRSAHNPFGDMSEITVRHLMTHSAGFRNPTWTWRDGSKDWQPFEPRGWAQLVAMMPLFEYPDVGFGYYLSQAPLLPCYSSLSLRPPTAPPAPAGALPGSKVLNKASQPLAPGSIMPTAVMIKERMFPYFVAATFRRDVSNS